MKCLHLNVSEGFSWQQKRLQEKISAYFGVNHNLLHLLWQSRVSDAGSSNLSPTANQSAHPKITRARVTNECWQREWLPHHDLWISMWAKAWMKQPALNLADVHKQSLHVAAHQVVRLQVAIEQFSAKCLVYGTLLICVAFVFLY